MTLGVMWVRTIGTTSELVVASDSRVTGGKRWDHCPKIVPLQRGDCVLSFSGETDYAYPLILHALSTTGSWPDGANRRFPLENLRGLLVRVLNSALSDLDHGGLRDLPPDQTFLMLGGFSWKTQRWVIWRLEWSAERGTIRNRSVKVRSRNQIGAHTWTGDRSAVSEARERLSRLLKSRNKSLGRDGLDMEPLEVLRDVVREAGHPSVGGPLQLAKVYRHLNTRMFLVKWPDDEGNLRETLSGRFLLPAEMGTGLHSIDPDRPNVFSPEFAKDDGEA